MFSAERLAEIMRVQGRQVRWLAEQTDYERETVTRYLNGHYPISAKFAERAARALGVPVHWLEAPVTAPARESTEVAV